MKSGTGSQDYRRINESELSVNPQDSFLILIFPFTFKDSKQGGFAPFLYMRVNSFIQSYTYLSFTVFGIKERDFERAHSDLE